MSVTPEAPQSRRPLTTRSSAWAQALARALVNTRISPNAISVISIVFAIVGAYVLLAFPSTWALVVTAVCIQLRLLCNLLDGMVAIEGGKKTATGGLYNEVPDRIADSLFIVTLGYAAGEPWLGWFGALAAAVTAYIRVLGGTCGLPQDFRGPLAKPHRMAVMTLACLLAAVEYYLWGTAWCLVLGAWVIAIGSVATCVTRTLAIARQLRERATPV